jgi:hypothetical protein
VGRQSEDGEPPPVGLGQHLSGHGRGAVCAAVGQRGGAHRVQPLHQRPAVRGVRGRQPGAEDDEHVGAGAGERIGGIVDHHVPHDPAEAGRTGRDSGTGESRQVEDVLDGQAHPLAPAEPLLARLGT